MIARKANDTVLTALKRQAAFDLLIERPDGRLWAVEIKRGRAARIEKGFHQARADLKPERAFVVYNGAERYPAAEGVEAIGLRQLADELSA